MPGNVRSKSISASIVLKEILVLLPLQVDGDSSTLYRVHREKTSVKML